MSAQHRSLFLLVAVVFLALSCNPARTAPAADFNSDQYQPRTLADLASYANTVVDLEEFKQSPSGSIYLEMDNGYTAPSRVAVTYSGEFRETPYHHIFAISEWIRPRASSMSDEDIIAMFKYEGYFTEGSTPYWLPMQTNLVQGMQQELKAGDVIVLYLRWIALTQMEGKVDYIFIVNAWINSH